VQSRRFAHQFAARFGEDWPVVIAPLMEVVPLAPVLPAADELIFTSENGVACFLHSEPARGRLAYCVGARTAKVAEAAGFRVVIGSGDALGLIERIKADHRGGILLHPRGSHVARNLADDLNIEGIETKQAIVYEQIPLGLPVGVQALLATHIPILVPLFSPRSAEIFAFEARDADAQLLLCPISRNVAERLQGLARSRIVVAEVPDASGVLAAIARQIGSF
jgi:uroporphyrinogen-III synthase